MRQQQHGGILPFLAPVLGTLLSGLLGRGMAKPKKIKGGRKAKKGGRK
jgi:hypothetical protein